MYSVELTKVFFCSREDSNEKFISLKNDKNNIYVEKCLVKNNLNLYHDKALKIVKG